MEGGDAGPRADRASPLLFEADWRVDIAGALLGRYIAERKRRARLLRSCLRAVEGLRRSRHLRVEPRRPSPVSSKKERSTPCAETVEELRQIVCARACRPPRADRQPRAGRGPGACLRAWPAPGDRDGPALLDEGGVERLRGRASAPPMGRARRGGERGVHGEVGRRDVVEVVPADRERHRHARPDPRAVGGDDGGAADAGGVDEHLAARGPPS